MANYRKHRTGGKRGGRRYENKQQRAAERQSLDGGNPKLVRSGSWSHRPQQPLAETERAQVSAQPKPKKKKDRGCPLREHNKRHHFLRDTRSREHWQTKFVDHETWVVTEERCLYIEHYKLCAYCGLEEIFRVDIKVDKKNPGTREYNCY